MKVNNKVLGYASAGGYRLLRVLRLLKFLAGANHAIVNAKYWNLAKCGK